MIVMKFGGTSVGSAERIRNVVKIVKSRLGSRPIIVVSAFGGVTDALLDVANVASKGEKYEAKLDGILQRHYDTIEELGLRREIINPEIVQLAGQIRSIKAGKELTPKDLDMLVSFGERLSSIVIADYMSKIGIAAKARNSYDIGLITDDNFGDADVLPEAYPKIRRSLGAVKVVPVITGFVGKDRKGNITTLGRGGSDYTASIIGAAVGAKEIQIWTDVNGIMTADPKIIKNAKSIPIVSYNEASELAFLGAKVLHPKTILPAIDNKIPVRILNTFNPKHRGTIVLRDIKANSRVASIAYKKRIQVINISNPKMFQSHGFLRKTFEIFDKHGVSVDMVSTSEINVSITLDGKQNTAKLIEELGKIAKVEAMSNRAKISMVGKNMIYIPGILGKLFTSLNGIHVEMVSSSTSEINHSFVVEEKDAEKAVKKLHKTFFGR